MSLDTIKTDGEISAEIEELRYETRFRFFALEELIEERIEQVKFRSDLAALVTILCTALILKTIFID